MAPKYPWIQLHSGISAVQVDRLLDDLKGYKSYASQRNHRCKVCPENVNNHKMWYRIMKCDSATCGTTCEWYVKILTCLEEYDTPTHPTSTTRNVSIVYQHGRHDSLDRSPVRKKMKVSVKRFVKERTKVGARPARVHGEIATEFCDVEAKQLPKLKQVQRVSYRYRKKTLLQDATVKRMNQLVDEHPRPRADGGATVPYAYAHTRDEEGRAQVGRGTEAKPTLVAVTTRSLLGNIRAADKQVLHIDATFKLNESGFPVIVFGISDRARTFHPISFFVSSQLQAVHYERAIEGLFNEYEQTFGVAPVVSAIMADADDALYNALDTVYAARGEARPTHLMCFFHVMMNVKKRIVSLTKMERRRVKDLIYDMHFSQDAGEFEACCREAQSSWSSSPELKAFYTYFKKQWIDSRFHRWQCFWTKPGVATTNNPVEQFNRVIKRDYSLGALVSVNTMFEQFFKMARAKAKYQVDVVCHRMPVENMMARYRYLKKGSLLDAELPRRSSMLFLLSGDASSVRVYQSDTIDRNVPLPKKKTGGKKFFCSTTNHRQNKFEMRAQPGGGWKVDTTDLACGCKIAYKFGFCAHLVAALKASDLPIPGREEDEVFLNRRVRAGAASSQSSGGRPRNPGPALSLV